MTSVRHALLNLVTLHVTSVFASADTLPGQNITSHVTSLEAHKIFRPFYFFLLLLSFLRVTGTSKHKRGVDRPRTVGITSAVDRLVCWCKGGSVV